MKGFWLFNEGNSDTAEMLTPLILFSTPITLWCPSAAVIDDAAQTGRSKIDKYGMLDLVEQGIVRISGRLDWFQNGDNRRRTSAGWRGAVWDDEFDEKLLAILDADRESDAPRVFTLADERGYTVADEEIEKRSEKFEKSIEAYKSGSIATGTRQRIERRIFLMQQNQRLTRLDAEMIAAREIIRDSMNHEEARRQVGADFSVETDPNWLNTVADISERPSFETTPETDITEEDLKSALDFALSISGKETVTDILQIKARSSEKALLQDLICKERNLHRRLAAQVRQGRDTSGLIEDTVGSKLSEVVTSLGTAGVSVAGMMAYAQKNGVSRRDVLKATVGFGLLPIIGNTLERYSAIPEYDYSGPIWPFAFKFGTRHPSRNDIELMINLLQEKGKRKYNSLTHPSSALK